MSSTDYQLDLERRVGKLEKELAEVKAALEHTAREADYAASLLKPLAGIDNGSPTR